MVVQKRSYRLRPFLAAGVSSARNPEIADVVTKMLASEQSYVPGHETLTAMNDGIG